MRTTGSGHADDVAFSVERKQYHVSVCVYQAGDRRFLEVER